MASKSSPVNAVGTYSVKIGRKLLISGVSRDEAVTAARASGKKADLYGTFSTLRPGDHKVIGQHTTYLCSFGS